MSNDNPVSRYRHSSLGVQFIKVRFTFANILIQYDAISTALGLCLAQPT